MRLDTPPPPPTPPTAPPPPGPRGGGGGRTRQGRGTGPRTNWGENNNIFLFFYMGNGVFFHLSPSLSVTMCTSSFSSLLLLSLLLQAEEEEEEGEGRLCLTGLDLSSHPRPRGSSLVIQDFWLFSLCILPMYWMQRSRCVFLRYFCRTVSRECVCFVVFGASLLLLPYLEYVITHTRNAAAAAVRTSVAQFVFVVEWARKCTLVFDSKKCKYS